MVCEKAWLLRVRIVNGGVLFFWRMKEGRGWEDGMVLLDLDPGAMGWAVDDDYYRCCSCLGNGVFKL